MEDDSKTVVVIDNGSNTIKAGFAGDDAPRKIFPSYIGYSKPHPINLAMDEKAYYVGDEARDRRGRLQIRHPIVDSLVNNWEDLENTWTHTFFNVLKVCPDESYAVITESPLNPPKYREKSIEILFELFNLEGAYLASKSLLSLYSTGRTTGCVVDSGHGVSFAVPIYEGYASPHAIQKLDIGGRHLDEYLNQILLEKGYEFTTPLELEILSEIKEKLCYVQESTKITKTKETEVKTYHLPDDSIVRLSTERHSIPEALFNPKEKLNINQPGLHQCVFKSIMKTNTEVRSEMFSNIVLAGGNTLFENFNQRLTNEIHLLAPPTKTDIKVVDNKERIYSSWIGGSIIGHMDTFQHLCISRKDFEEFGSKIVHDKTF
jgi:actin